jgi:hypothetical protein
MGVKGASPRTPFLRCSGSLENGCKQPGDSYIYSYICNLSWYDLALRVL